MGSFEELIPGSGIYQLTIPTNMGTGDNHTYFGEGSGGWTVIDPGTKLPAGQAMWKEALKEIGISFRQIKEIYVTHNHPDHFGLAGWLQEQSGAEVFLSPTDISTNEQFLLPEKQHIALLMEYMGPYGVPPSIPEILVKEVQRLMPFITPIPDLTLLEAGHTFHLGDDEYETLPSPGHTDGHVSFLGKRRKRLLSGDALCLDRVSQLSEWPYSSLTNPMQVQMQALHDIVDRGVTQVLAGHGVVFDTVRERLTEIEEEHRKRINKVEKTLQREMTLVEVCRILDVKARTPHEMRVSWGDTRAYLEYLWQQGRITKNTGPVISYAPK